MTRAVGAVLGAATCHRVSAEGQCLLSLPSRRNGFQRSLPRKQALGYFLTTGNPRINAFRLTSCSATVLVPSEDGRPETTSTLKSGGNGLLASIRAFSFYLSTFVLAVPLFIVMCLMAPFVAIFDRKRRLAQHIVNNVWAKLSSALYYKVEIEGKENLPSMDTPAVYVANHLSALDIFTLFHLNRPFKFVSKTSIFFIPIIGWSMFLTDGCSVLFFPEGTRSNDGKLHDFKKGAFSTATKGKVPVVPVTILGTNQLMPNGQEGRLYSPAAPVRMVVHPPISGTNAAELAQQARAAIASAMPSDLVA